LAARSLRPTESETVPRRTKRNGAPISVRSPTAKP